MWRSWDVRWRRSGTVNIGQYAIDIVPPIPTVRPRLQRNLGPLPAPDRNINIGRSIRAGRDRFGTQFFPESHDHPCHSGSHDCEDFVLIGHDDLLFPDTKIGLLPQMTTAPQLKLVEDSRAGWVRLMLSGRLTVAAAGELHAAVRGLPDRGMSVAVDCADAEYLDVAAIQVLLCLGRALAARGKQSQLTGVGPHLRDSFLLVGLGAASTP